MSKISVVNYLIMHKGFPSGKLTLNFGYFFSLLLIGMCQMKFYEKQDEVTYNAGSLMNVNMET